MFFLIFQVIVPTNIAHASTNQDLAFDTTVTGNITMDNKQDTYKIILSKAGKININMISSISQVSVNLKDTDGNETLADCPSYENDQTPKPWTNSVDLEAGTYYFNVSQYGSSTGKYTLEVNFTASNGNDVEPNNGTLTAQPITLNSNPITGYISWNDDKDMYKIVLPKTGKIDINMISSISQLVVKLTDTAGKEVLSAYPSCENDQTSTTCTNSVDLEAGTYYFNVSKYTSGTGKYTLGVNFTASGGDDVEPNNGTLTAQPITLNSAPVAGFISWNDDQDTYKIVLAKAGKININMISLISDAHVNLTDANGNIILSEFPSCENDQTPKIWTDSVDLEAGNYYFNVLKESLYSSSTGKYTIGVTAVGQPISPITTVSTVPTAVGAIEITNNLVRTPDIVTLNNSMFTSGDIVTLYADDNSGKTIGLGTVDLTQDKTIITTSEQLAQAGGYVYVTVKGVDKTESPRLRVSFSKEISNNSTDFNSMANGTIVIGNKVFTLAYANDSANAEIINSAIVAGGSIYVKNFSGDWINNLTGQIIEASTIPSMV
ncbi:hypothetical protein LL127_09260 [Clostridium estertheticum]|uniref:hypothetical protein n=1 Tax=Clostridium estertheticum TaxID=238834 RepID=UPI001CF197AA|nr:hypothetical protein [Clostridium estertheticum]MCB2306068.1 hypothetical protein [Clostridium estertheticum]MCB2346591.1 hypothetical protein [Clostridium estertheticum]WAG47603.1 hypothetical protein LL127_09260 [Clostridium estertheticum]